MPKGVMLVLSTPKDGVDEEEFNNWYDSVHVPEVTAVPGVVSARRFRISGTQVMERSSIDGLPYLAVYELDCEDFADPVKELTERAEDGRLAMGDLLQTDPLPMTVLFEEC